MEKDIFRIYGFHLKAMKYCKFKQYQTNKNNI